MEIDVSSLSDIGKVRTDNEDCLIINENHHLYCISDGMGGLAYGKVTAEIVKDQLISYFHLMNKNNIKITSEIIENIIKKISEHIQMMGNVFGSQMLYGATLTGVVLDEEKMFVMNVGDSRVYKYNSSGLSQLTKDQNLKQYLIDRGEFNQDDLKSHYIHNVVLEFMGKPPSVKPDIVEMDIEYDTLYCICSDGLFSMIDENSIFEILKEDSILDNKCQQLVDAANNVGGKDNISVILIKLRKE